MGRRPEPLRAAAGDGPQGVELDRAQLRDPALFGVAHVDPAWDHVEAYRALLACGWRGLWDCPGSRWFVVADVEDADPVLAGEVADRVVVDVLDTSDVLLAWPGYGQLPDRGGHHD